MAKLHRDLEGEMQFAIQAAGLLMPEHGYKFWPGRRHEFDFAWPHLLLALEVMGGTFSGGAHVRGARYEQDCEKLCEAAIRGWRVMYVTAAMIDDGRALAFIERALNKPSTSTKSS